MAAEALERIGQNEITKYSLNLEVWLKLYSTIFVSVLKIEYGVSDYLALLAGLPKSDAYLLNLSNLSAFEGLLSKLLSERRYYHHNLRLKDRVYGPYLIMRHSGLITSRIDAPLPIT